MLLLLQFGCYAQVSSDDLKKIEEVDLILGNNEKKEIVKYVEEYEKSKTIHLEDILHQKDFVDFGLTTHIEKTRAVIKVQDGCDRFCSYCIIPYARGRVRSRRIENIIEEIKLLTKNGIKEVVITGIHIASYGKDFKDGISLIDLLEMINKVEGIERIRLGSLEPTLIDEEFLSRLSKLKKVCHHFHLSLQSGCDETLARMNRKYTTEEFKHIVELLRNTYSDVILTTDIIVGFPGETDEEFNQTYEFLKEIRFYKMHIFKYSRRKGTKADLMPNQIDSITQNKRSQKLIKLSNDNELEYNKKYVGKTLEVLFEEQDGKFIKGHTQNFLLVKVQENSNVKYHNQIIKIKLKKAEIEEIVGEM